MSKFRLLILLIAGLSLIWMPFLIAKYFFPINGEVLMNLTAHNWADYGSYAAWVKQGADMHLLFKQLYTIDISNGYSIFHPGFLLTGFISKVFSLNAFTSLLLFRSFGLFILIFSLIKFKSVFSELKDDNWYLYFIVFSSGLGWFWNNNFIDLTQSESSIFFSIFASVLNPFSLGLIVLIFYYFLVEKIKYRLVIILSLILCLGFIHLYDLVVVLLATMGFTIFSYQSNKNSELVRTWVALFAATLVVLILQFFVLMNNSALGVWVFIQTQVSAPTLVEWLAVYFLFILFSSFFLLVKKSSLNKNHIFLLIWSVVNFILLFNPISIRYQQKLSLGFFIAIGTLAYLGLKIWFKNIKGMNSVLKICLVLSLIIIFCSSNIFLVYSSLRGMNNNKNWFLSTTQLQAAQKIQMIEKNCTKNLLSSYHFSNSLPGLTGCTVYIGHYDQTVDAEQKLQISQGMLASTAKIDHDPLKFFVRWENIDYILVDEEVRSWGGLDTNNRPYLKQVFNNEDVQIYEIDKSQLN